MNISMDISMDILDISMEKIYEYIFGYEQLPIYIHLLQCFSPLPLLQIDIGPALSILSGED